MITGATVFYIDKRRCDFYHSNAVFFNDRGVLAQLGERVVRNHEVRGSIPLYSTIRCKRRDDPSLVAF